MALKESVILRRPPPGSARSAARGQAPRPSRRTHGIAAFLEEDTVSAYFYILRCADGSYYVGTTAGSLEKRIAEHQTGACAGYTSLRRPVALVFREHFGRLEDAAATERQVKGWRREKKQALIRGDFAALRSLARRRGAGVRPSRRPLSRPPQDDEFT